MLPHTIMDFSGKRILFIGFRGKHSHLVSARKQGMVLDLLIDASEMKEGYNKEFTTVHVLPDIFDWRQIEEALTGMQYDAVLTRFEDFTLLVSAIAEHLNLPSVSMEDAPKFRNKYLMRKAFAEHGVPSAGFALVQSAEDARPMVEHYGFPLIVKQIAGIHSKYVARVNSEEELASTITFFLEALSKEESTLHGQLHHYPKKIEGQDYRNSLLVEECITGEELTVDAFVVDGEPYLTPICKYVMPEDMGFDDHHLPVRVMPYDLAPADQDLVNTAVKKSLTALGANYCVTHAEVFFDKEKKECRLIEVASRGGGFRAEMVRHTCGGDYDLGLIRSALGTEPDVDASPTSYAAVAEVFSPENGILEEIDYSCLENQSDVFSITHNKHRGDMVGRASDGHSFVLKFLVKADSYADADARSRELLLAVRSSIRTQPV